MRRHIRTNGCPNAGEVSFSIVSTIQQEGGAVILDEATIGPDRDV